MSGVNHCFSNLGPLFISCERFFTGSPLSFCFFPPVSLTWEPLSFPPQARSLHTLRPTAKVLLQANFWKTLGQEGSCPCWTMFLPVVTVVVFFVNQTQGTISSTCMTVDV